MFSDPHKTHKYSAFHEMHRTNLYVWTDILILCMLYVQADRVVIYDLAEMSECGGAAPRQVILTTRMS